MLGRDGLLLRLAFAWAMFLCAAMPAAGTAMAAEPDAVHAPEAVVKAAFLFKFGGYVEWPPGTFASPAAPLTIGVIDADELADELTKLVVGRDIDGRAVVVRKLRDTDPPAAVHILFVGKAGAGRIAQILSPLKGRPVLSVTETDGALDQGSVINFVVVDSKVRFDVALQSASLEGLKISSRLLSVARKVSGAP